MMRDHVAYWTGHLEAGTAVAFGPVADPNGGWGVGIVRDADEAAVRQLEARDPAVLSGRGFRYDIFAKPGAVAVPPSP